MSPGWSFRAGREARRLLRVGSVSAAALSCVLATGLTSGLSTLKVTAVWETWLVYTAPLELWVQWTVWTSVCVCCEVRPRWRPGLAPGLAPGLE